MTDSRSASTPRTTWRQRLGTLMFVVPFPVFFLTPILVPFMGFSVAQTAGIIGAILIGVELIWFASIPLLGRQGFDHLKQRMFSFLRLSTKPISRTRHRVGLALLMGGILVEAVAVIGVVIGYFVLPAESTSGEFLGLTFDQEATLFVGSQILAAVCLVAAMYCLGAGFVERLKAALAWAGDSA